MARQHTYLSLDVTGTQAGVYPSEDVLWVQGPPINDAGAQGVEYSGSEQLTAPPPAPRSVKDTEATEDFLHEVINGETSNGAYGEIWVNPEVIGPTGFGPWNNPDVFQSGHSQNVVSNPSAEQGWGVGPARRWAHYPFSESPNPMHNMGQHLRNGQYPFVTADSSFYERTQLAWEQQWAGYKHRGPVAPVVDVAPSVPYVQTIPTYGGGPIQIPGVDIPFDESGVYG